MPRHLLSIDDLTDAELDAILLRASELRQAPHAALPSERRGKIVGLMFLQTSLRTRVGFATACARLGWQSVSVLEQRSSEVSMAESIEDTLRVAAGMVDLLVARLPIPVGSVVTNAPVPVVNGGDSGPFAEHPTQALIDLFAIEQERGNIRDLHVAICGDLRMRGTRSLMKLLARRSPGKLSTISVSGLTDHTVASDVDPATVSQLTLKEVSDVDVLYVTGIPHRAIPEDVRDTLRVTGEVMDSLPRDAVVLSPLPVIDEIDAYARRDPRIRMFTQSDNGVYARMAVLEALAGSFSG